MTTRFWLLPTTNVFPCLTTVRWLSKSKTWIMLPQLLYLDAVSSTSHQLILVGSLFSRHGPKIEWKIRTTVALRKVNGLKNLLRSTLLSLTSKSNCKRDTHILCLHLWLLEFHNSWLSWLPFWCLTSTTKNQLTRKSLNSISFTVWLGLSLVFSKLMTVWDSSVKSLRSATLLSPTSQLLAPKPIKKPCSTTAWATRTRHGRCGKSQSGYRQRDLSSLNSSSLLRTQLVPSSLCREMLPYQWCATKDVMKPTSRTLFLLVVQVPQRHLYASCSRTPSTQPLNLSNVSTSLPLLSHATSKTQLKLRLNVNKLRSSSHQTTRKWLSSLMTCLCLLLTLGVIRLLLKSLVNWLTKKVSISLRKTWEATSNKSTTCNSWVLWIILVVVVTISLIVLNVNSSR